jgi:hypothetical protein
MQWARDGDKIEENPTASSRFSKMYGISKQSLASAQAAALWGVYNPLSASECATVPCLSLLNRVTQVLVDERNEHFAKLAVARAQAILAVMDKSEPGYDKVAATTQLLKKRFESELKTK